MHKGMMLAVSAAMLLASAAFAQDNSGNLEKLVRAAPGRLS
jgi:hypothetical protein